MAGVSNISYFSTKTYEHSVGLSCCFRQWRANSHCKYLHGYAIKVHLRFGTYRLDHRNWVVDFGSLKGFKTQLETLLDHKTLVAQDDPELETFTDLAEKELIQVVIVPATGCEGIAQMVWQLAEQWLIENDHSDRVWLEEVIISEHDGNSAGIKRNQ